MHMADALLSPAVGGTFWAGTIGTIGYASKMLKEHLDDRKIPLMGVLGAFIFASQMINFTIPGTGSSGHLGGGMILAVLLGPHAASLVMASVLAVQAGWSQLIFWRHGLGERARATPTRFFTLIPANSLIIQYYLFAQ